MPKTTASTPTLGPRKVAGRGVLPAKQIAHEILPTRDSRASIMSGAVGNRTIGQYAKMTPLDANGVGTIGLGLDSMARDAE